MDGVDRSKVIEIRVPFSDVGMHGQMFTTSYLRHAETAVLNFWKTRPEQAGEPVYIATKVSCTIHRGLRYDEFARFIVSIDKIGVKSVGFDVMVTAEGEPVAEAEILWVAHESEDGEPVPLPEATRDWLYQILD